MLVTLDTLAPSRCVGFCRVLLMFVVGPRYCSWACVVRRIRAPDGVTTVVAPVDVHQGVSSPLSTGCCFVLVSLFRSPLGRNQYMQSTPLSGLPFSLLEISPFYKVYIYIQSLDV